MTEDEETEIMDREHAKMGLPSFAELAQEILALPVKPAEPTTNTGLKARVKVAVAAGKQKIKSLGN